MKRVLVAGATGYLGRYVVKELAKQNYYVKVLVRNPQKLNHPGEVFAPSINEDVDEIIIGDLTKPHTLKGICDNIDMVFTSVGITDKSHGFTFEDVDYQGNLNLLREAEQSHVQKFMYIHVHTNDDWKKPNPLLEAKENFINDLQTSPMHHIIVKPTGYFTDITQIYYMAKKGRVYAVGNGQMKMNPIHGEDLAHVCVESLDTDRQTIHVGGPETLTYEQMATIAFDVFDKKMRITHIPAGLLRVLMPCVKIFNNHYYGLLRFFTYVMTNHITAPEYGKRTTQELFNELHAIDHE